MTKLHLHIGLYILLAFLICACTSPGPNPTLTSTSIPFLSSAYTPTPSTTQIPTPAISQTPRTLPLATIYLPPTNILQYQCLDIAPSLPEGTHPRGMLVLMGHFGEHSLLLNMETGEKDLLKDAQGPFNVSPDAKWLASFFVDTHAEPTRTWLAVVSADGKQHKLIPWDDSWFLIGGWLDNQRIWISRYQEPLLVVVHPFTGEVQDVAPDYPGLETLPMGGLEFPLGFSSVSYNASMSLALYPKVDADGYNLVLWDVQGNRVLAKVIDKGYGDPHIGNNPLWSLDGKQVIVKITERVEENHGLFHAIDALYSLTQDGQARPLTHFGEFFTDTGVGVSSLSPDRKRLAFWLQVNPSPYQGYMLAVLDLATQHVTDYCIPGPYRDAYFPIWSPDSRYIAVENIYELNASRVIVVDTEQGWAAQIADNLQPQGWMITSSTPTGTPEP